MPARTIMRNAQGRRCVRTTIVLFPTRDDLIAALSRARHYGAPLPTTQTSLLEVYNQSVLAGHSADGYPPSDDAIQRVDHLFPGLRETDHEATPPR